jgi:choline dehydrogenase-like flavoprotein
VLLHANVTRIALNESARAVESLEIQSLDGHRLRARARHHVLATGGIENPRLLLASNDVQSPGVANQNGLVGRFFMEHPHTDDAGFILWTRALRNLNFYDLHTVEGVRVWGVLRPTQEALGREQMPNFMTMLYPVRRDASGDPSLDSLSRAFHETDSWALEEPERQPPVQLVTLGTVTEPLPNPESRVTLDDSVDALGMPRVKLDWRLQKKDRDHLRRAHELVASSLGRSGEGRFRWTPELKQAPWPPQMVGGYHHMGTTRMHDDPKRGVVDANARVHGLANLSVAGSSVFPTVGCANPTLTIVALALRLADHLRGELA